MSSGENGVVRARVSAVGAGVGVVVGLTVFSATLLSSIAWVSFGIAFAVSALVGIAVAAVAAIASAVYQDRVVRVAWDRQAAVLRELVRTVVPRAVDLATDQADRLDPDRFQDLVVASIAAASDPRMEFVVTGSAVWEIDGCCARSTEQEQRFQRLSTYPSLEEAPALLGALAGMGPQTIVQFATFATHTRSRLAVGMEGTLAGPVGALLTSHLIAAGLVELVDGPSPGTDGAGTEVAFYALSPTGADVARLFAPTTSRPQELAALDPMADEHP